MGLVSLVEQSLRRRIISKLTQTWSTLSLGQLTKLLGMDEKDEAQVEAVEREVLGMVSVFCLSPRKLSMLMYHNLTPGSI